MSIRVYECDKSEADALKKVLEYDPYLDPSRIPKSRYDEKELKKLSPEEQKAYEEDEAKRKEAMKKLSEDKFANVIFARQDYDLRDGGMFGLDSGKYYLYLSAPDDFLSLAEERFKNEFKSIKRAPKEVEEKVTAKIKEEKDKVNVGLGSIFGS